MVVKSHWRNFGSVSEMTWADGPPDWKFRNKTSDRE